MRELNEGPTAPEFSGLGGPRAQHREVRKAPGRHQPFIYLGKTVSQAQNWQVLTWVWLGRCGVGGPVCGLGDPSPAGLWHSPLLKSRTPWALLFLPTPPPCPLSQEPCSQLLTLPVPQGSHF